MGLPKPKEKNINRQTQNNRLRDDAILESILQNEYILVIGSEAILKPDLEGTDKSGNSLVLLYNAMLQEQRIKLPPKSWSEKKWQEFFRQQRIHKDLLEAVEDIIREGDEDGSYYKLDDISEELDALVRTKHFPVVITTSVDGYLELLMRDVWGDDLRIVNFYEDKSLRSFYGYIESFKKGELFMMPPTLIYAFGKANYTRDGVNKCKFVFTEDDAIEAISNWLKIQKTQPRLYDYIEPKKIMAIGCKFNDWKFRFFWYSLRQDITRLGEGTVAISFNAKTDDSTYSDLKQYLLNENIPVDSDSRMFMKHIVGLLNPDPTSTAVNVYESVLKKRRNTSGYIFLSYPHEDFSIVFQIFTHLVESGYNVWLDNKNLYSSDIYEEKIRTALDNCTVFMPILSKQVSEDLADNNLSRFYLRKEWNRAKERRSLKTVHVIPLATSDYNVNGGYHRVGFRNYWNIKDEKDDITIEYIENIEHFKQGLDKLLKK